VFSLESLANGASQDVLLEVQQQTMGYLLDERLNKLEEVAQVCKVYKIQCSVLYKRLCIKMDTMSYYHFCPSPEVVFSKGFPCLQMRS